MDLVESALSQESTMDARGALMAPAVRLMKLCQRDLPSTDLENNITGNVSGGTSWERASIICALDPTNVQIGSDLWSGMQTYVNPNGGANTHWSITFDATYALVSMITTTQDDCVSNGIVVPRSS